MPKFKEEIDTLKQMKVFPVPILPKIATMAIYQTYVSKLEQERGFVEQTSIDKCLLLGEEIGELFKAIRNAEGLKIDPESGTSEISYELVDIFIYLCAIANRYNIDLEKAFREKEAINKTRYWKS